MTYCSAITATSMHSGQHHLHLVYPELCQWLANQQPSTSGCCCGAMCCRHLWVLTNNGHHPEDRAKCHKHSQLTLYAVRQQVLETAAADCHCSAANSGAHPAYHACLCYAVPPTQAVAEEDMPPTQDTALDTAASDALTAPQAGIDSSNAAATQDTATGTAASDALTTPAVVTEEDAAAPTQVTAMGTAASDALTTPAVVTEEDAAAPTQDTLMGTAEDAVQQGNDQQSASQTGQKSISLYMNAQTCYSSAPDLSGRYLQRQEDFGVCCSSLVSHLGICIQLGRIR